MPKISEIIDSGSFDKLQKFRKFLQKQESKDDFKNITEFEGKECITFGKTFNTPLEAEVGDILDVQVQEITISDGKLTWAKPQVVGIDKTRKEPYTTEQITRLAQDYEGVLQKAREGLVPKKITVHRGGKTFQRTQWVRPEEAKLSMKEKTFEIFPGLQRKITFYEAEKTIVPCLKMLPLNHVERKPVSIKANDLKGRGLAIYNPLSESIELDPGILTKDLKQKLIDHYGQRSQQEIIQLIFLHEYGHHFSSFMSRFFMDEVTKIFRNKKTEKDLITQYASTHQAEYFAESYAFYIIAPKTLKEKDLEIYEFLKEKVFDGREY